MSNKNTAIIINEFDALARYSQVMTAHLETLNTLTEESAVKLLNMFSELNRISNTVTTLADMPHVAQENTDNSENKITTENKEQQHRNAFIQQATLLRQEIEAGLSHMQFQDISRQQIDGLKIMLSKLENHFSDIARQLKENPNGPVTDSRLEAILSDHQESYVMTQQNNSHNQVLKLDTQEQPEEENDPSRIQLF